MKKRGTPRANDTNKANSLSLGQGGTKTAITKPPSCLDSPVTTTAYTSVAVFPVRCHLNLPIFP